MKAEEECAGRQKKAEEEWGGAQDRLGSVGGGQVRVSKSVEVTRKG